MKFYKPNLNNSLHGKDHEKDLFLFFCALKQFARSVCIVF